MTSIMRGIGVGWLRKFWTLQDQAEAGRFASVFVEGNVTKGTGWDFPSASEGSKVLAGGDIPVVRARTWIPRWRSG
jgi:hypothetical protein